jgi:hypothetical protein
MMSPSKQKRKGDAAEREIVDMLNSSLLQGKAKKNPGSGAIGTNVGESLLTGDINLEIYGFPRKIKAECKSGYGNKAHLECKSLRIEKAWLDKIAEEAEANFRLPIFFGKFDNVRKGTKIFCAMDIEVFILLANHITKLREELDRLHDKQ